MLSAAVFIAAAAGMVAASPAPQQLDFAQLAAAPEVATGPVGIALNQSVPAASDVVVSSVATAVAAPTALSRRGNSKANNQVAVDALAAWQCLVLNKCSTSAISSVPCTTSTTPLTYYTTVSGLSSSVVASASASATSAKSASSSVSASASKSATSATSASAAASSSSSSSSSSAAASSTSASSTTQSTTGTSTDSSSSTCPTQIEEGTYCGFINPEDPCSPQPGGYGPVPSPDTVAAFQSYPEFQSESESAPTQVASSAQGVVYNQVFQGLNASVESPSYIGLYTLTSYDVPGCAAICDGVDLCTAFDMFVERDPSVNPSKNDSSAPTVWGYWCPNPPSITEYKCTLFGSNIDASMAVNTGEWREDFQTVIVGSNGYDKTNSTTPSCGIPSPSGSSSSSSAAVAASTSSISSASTTLATTAKSSSTAKTTSSAGPTKTPTWSAGHNCNGKAVSNTPHWMGSKVFPGPFNPQVCADYAWAQSGANKAVAVLNKQKSFTPCSYFNAVYYHKNGRPFGTYCTLYDQVLDDSFNTYSGGRSGADSYECKQSWTYQLQVDASFSSC